MGMNKEVYIGAYIEVIVKENITRYENFGCPDHDLPWDSKPEGGFCKICGVKLDKFFKEARGFPDYWDLVEGHDHFDDVLADFGELFEPEGTIILKGNDLDDGCGFDADDRNYEIKPKDIKTMKENFKKHYKDILVFLTNSDEVIKINVLFGAVIYYC